MIDKILLKRNSLKIVDFDKIIKSNVQNSLTKIGFGAQAEIYKIVKDVVIKRYFKEKSHEFKRELDALIKVKKLIEDNISPHYLYMYSYSMLKYELYFEEAQGSIKTVFNNMEIPLKTKVVQSFFFQILYGILCEYELLHILHRDVLPNNILVKTINSKISYKYTINNKKFTVPTFGNLFLLCDYGRSLTYTKKNYDFKDFIVGIISLFSKQLINSTYHDINMFYTLLPKEQLIKNDIDISLPIREIITKCIILNIIDYKKLFPKSYNVIELSLEILNYENILDVLINVFPQYLKNDESNENDKNVIVLTPINI